MRSVFSDGKRLSFAILSQTLPDQFVLRTMPSLASSPEMLAGVLDLNECNRASGLPRRQTNLTNILDHRDREYFAFSGSDPDGIFLVSTVYWRTSSGAHSVQPVAISVKTRVCVKAPFAGGPECATRSASTKPGAGLFQSENVRMGTLRLIAVEPLRRRCPVAFALTPLRMARFS
jgi:hypothetical protein